VICNILKIQMLIVKVIRMIMHWLTLWYHMSWSNGQHSFM